MPQDDQAPVIQLTKSGPVISGRPVSLRHRFDTQQCVVLKNLLSPQLLEEVRAIVERSQWQDGDEYTEGSGTLLTSTDPAASRALHFLLNSPELLKIIAAVTGCEDISEFRLGAIYRMVAADQHHLSWHNDLNDDENRQVGLSLNLSTEVFRGGAFELRESVTRKLLAEVDNTGFGDALIFRVSSGLEHRVAPVTEGTTKTAFTGWFCATGRNYVTRLMDQIKREQAAGS